MGEGESWKEFRLSIVSHPTVYRHSHIKAAEYFLHYHWYSGTSI